jgi:MFS family permease
MRLLLPQLAWTGISIAYYAGLLVTIISMSMDSSYSSADQYKYSLLSMSALGIGEMTGGLLIGRITDRFSSKAGCFLTISSMTLTVAMISAYLAISNFSILAAFLAFSWGL